MRFLLALLVLNLGCAHPRPQKLKVQPMVTVEFVGIRDGKCRVRYITVDSQTGHQVVHCE